MLDDFLDANPVGAKCAVCGVPAKNRRPRTPADPPFIRGEVIVEMVPLGYCHHCSVAFCGRCNNGMHCPRCGQVLLADPPTGYRPDVPTFSFSSWLRRLFGR